MTDTTPARHLPRRQLYDHLLADASKGGFFWTQHVSQRIGAMMAVGAVRRGMHPSTISLWSLATAVIASVAAIVLLPGAPYVAAGTALLGWQLSYGLDCADGQVARATGRTSVAGGRLDLTVDFAVQVAVAGCLATAATGVAWLPAPLAAVCVAASLFPLFDEATGRSGDAAVPSVDRSSSLYQASSLVRDQGVVKAAAAVALVDSRAAAVVLAVIGALGVTWTCARTWLLNTRSRAGGDDHA